MYTHIYIHIHIYTHIYIHIYTYIYTYTYIENSWCVAEWITLIGFACIGLEIDISKFMSSNKSDNTRAVLALYLCVQLLDICSTFGWSYLMFYNYNWDDSNGTTDPPPNPA